MPDIFNGWSDGLLSNCTPANLGISRMDEIEQIVSEVHSTDPAKALGALSIPATKMKVVMPYIGGVLSVNSYKIVGRGGHKTNKTHPVVEAWMSDLCMKVKGFRPPAVGKVIVRVTGKFKDERHPDMDNLSKVILDSIKVGIKLDDKYMLFKAEPPVIGVEIPELVIELEYEEE